MGASSEAKAQSVLEWLEAMHRVADPTAFGIPGTENCGCHEGGVDLMPLKGGSGIQLLVEEAVIG